MTEPRKPIKAPASNVPLIKTPAPKTAAPKTPASKMPPVRPPTDKPAVVKAPTGETPLIQVPTEKVGPPKPTQVDWLKPPFLVAYGLLGLLCLVGLYKWLFGSAGGPDLTRVRGTVTLEGKPLVGAVVSFHPVSKDGGVALGATDRFGHFGMKTPGLGNGVVPGEYRVTVTKLASEEKMMDPDEAKQYTSQTGKLPPSPKVTNLVPAKFASSETSGLSATVKPGATTPFQFDLK